MANSIYIINKGVNRSVEFKGLKAQYIWYVGIGVFVLIMIYGIMHVAGVNQYAGIAIVLGAGAMYIMKLYQLSNKYGAHGFMKFLAWKRVPKVLKCSSRKAYMRKDLPATIQLNLHPKNKLR